MIIQKLYYVCIKIRFVVHYVKDRLKPIERESLTTVFLRRDGLAGCTQTIVCLSVVKNCRGFCASLKDSFFSSKNLGWPNEQSIGRIGGVLNHLFTILLLFSPFPER